MIREFDKIKFQNKEDAISLNPSSTFILTADNINEIKRVINGLSDFLSVAVDYLQIFRYFRFNIPENLMKDIPYSLDIQLSKYKNFSEVISLSGLYSESMENFLDLPISESETEFSVFKDNSWQYLSAVTFYAYDANKEIRFDILSYLKDVVTFANDIPFFGRYRLINLNDNSKSEWIGFSLSFGNFNNKHLFKTKYKSIKIKGETKIFGEKTYLYSVFGILNNDSEIDITNDCEFKISNLNISTLNGNKLTTKKVYNTEVQKLTAIYEEYGITYADELIIQIAPLELVNYYINCPNEILENESIQFSIIGKFSDGSIKDLIQSSIISLNSTNCIRNGNVINSKSIAYDNELITLNAQYTYDNVIYNASKQILVKKKIYTGFNISENCGDEPTYNPNYLNLRPSILFGNSIRVLGKILSGENSLPYLTAQIKPVLSGNNIFLNDIKNITIKELNTSYLTFNKDINNNLISISINDESFNTILGTVKEVLILLMYNDYKTGKALVQPETIKIYNNYQEVITINVIGNIILSGNPSENLEIPTYDSSDERLRSGLDFNVSSKRVLGNILTGYNALCLSTHIRPTLSAFFTKIVKNPDTGTNTYNSEEFFDNRSNNLINKMHIEINSDYLSASWINYNPSNDNSLNGWICLKTDQDKLSNISDPYIDVPITITYNGMIYSDELSGNADLISPISETFNVRLYKLSISVTGGIYLNGVPNTILNEEPT